MREEELWLLQAEHDLEAADHNLRGAFLDQCLVCWQQAAEKALKALYIATHRKVPPRIHDIEELASAVELAHALPPEVAALTRWYLEARCPDLADVPPYQKLEPGTAQAALGRTRDLVREVRRRLHV